MTEPPTPPALARLRIDRPAAGSAPARRRRRWPWVVGALAVAAAVAFGWPRAVPVEITAVVTSTPSQQYVQLTASGYVVAQRRAAVASKATGRLVELRVREGSTVRSGELIARLDSSDVQAAVAAARAGIAQAEAGRRQAEAAVQQAEVERRNAEAELARSEALVGQGFVSPQALDAARTRRDAAAAAIVTARAAEATARAAVAQAQAQLRVQQVNEQYTQIRAPFDGVVLVKNANVGDIITPFSSAAGSLGSVVTMADMSTLEVEADVSEGNLAKAAIGQPVEILLDALPDRRFRGQVVGIVPTVDRAKATVMTKIRFDQIDPRVLPEMSAKVAFLSQPIGDADQRPVLATNPAAIVERAGATQVFRLQGEQVEAVPVTAGRTLGDLRELSPVAPATLAAGDRLVLRPGPRLAAGTRVAPPSK